MMRWFLALLVLANLFVFALYQGWLSPWLRSDREPQRLAEQRNAERLRVVPLDRLGAVPARAPTSARSTGSSTGPSTVPPAAFPDARPEPAGAAGGGERNGVPRDAEGAIDASAVLRPPPIASTATCVAFGPLDETRASRLREALEAAGARVESTRTEQAASYLVYLQPADTVAEAQRRLVAIRRIGPEDAFVILDGPLRLGISVGLYRSEEMAQALVDRLEGLGETRLRIAPRGAVTGRLRLQAHWSDATAAAVAPAIASRFDAQARNCD